MGQKPSEALVTWLEEHCRALGPGQRLPTNRELAATFGISQRTVIRKLEELSKRGLLVRIQGRGTFTPERTGAPPKAPRTPRSSTQTLVDVIHRSIRRGELSKGQPLPQVKYTCLKFRLSPATVAAAYRQLEEMGLVVKIGKSYWVGSFDSLIHTKPHKDVYLFKYRSLDFRDVYTDPILGRAYRTMEKELSAAGFLLRFETTDNLPKLIDAFLQSRRIPYGFVFFNMAPDQFNSVHPRLDRFLRQLKRMTQARPSVLLDLKQGSILSPLPRGIQVFSRGHISTSAAQAVARHLTEAGHQAALFFVDDGRRIWAIPPRAAFIKIWAEAGEAELESGLRVMVKTPLSVGEFAATLDRTIQHSSIKTLLDKYGPATMAPAEHDLLTTVSVNSATLDRHADAILSHDIWLFSHGDMAAEAFEWCRRRGVRIPHDISILSLENDPECYHLGISYCDPDLERTGYAMARTITAPPPTERTSKGFLRTHARLVQRLTTR